MHYANKAYEKIARETASPRKLEASLLLKAAAQLQAVHDSWNDKKPRGLDDALLYNRRLWTVFIDAVMSDDNKLPLAGAPEHREPRRICHGRDVFADD